MSDNNRKLTRRREKNYRTPLHQDVLDSVQKLVDYARKRAVRDHDDSFATKKERDLVATVYLQRAHDTLMDKVNDG